MSVVSGTRLGPFHILELIGAGGMGEVYRARDAALDRDVAIKILPELFLLDTERRLRLEREAKLLATLNHPHIAAIYSLERQEGCPHLVMEFVPGETLADLVARGRVPPADVSAIFEQLADALGAAHARGIVHRDLKPANVKLTPQGSIKVLDFGLARAGDAGISSNDPAQSPTLSYAATQAGVILGTAAYMSPEQARGKPVDQRADIWALGCILFELLSGRRAFLGETTSDVLVAVLRGEPDWQALPAETPAGLRRAIERCLQKDIAQRWTSANDLLLASKEPVSQRPDETRKRWQARVPLLTSLVAAGAIIGGVGAWKMSQPSLVPRAVRFSVQAPENTQLNLAYGSAVSFSPDGRALVFAATGDETGSQLFLRPTDRDDLQPVKGTEGGRVPAFSPDGQWIAFIADNHLKKVQVGGGVPETLCDVDSDARGVSWLGASAIVVNPGRLRGLLRVPAGGGAPTAIARSAEADVDQRWPEAMPDGRTVLVTDSREGVTEPHIVALDLASGQRREIVAGTHPRFVAPDFLFFARSDLNATIGTLWVARLDPRALRITEGPALVSENLRVNIGGAAHYSVSRSLDLALARVLPEREITVVDRSGRQLDAISARGLSQITLADDDRHLAGADERDLWIYDLDRRLGDRITNGDGSVWTPVWLPGSRRLVYAWRPVGNTPEYQILIRPLDSSSAPQKLTTSTERIGVLGVSPDGEWVIYRGTRDAKWVAVSEGARAKPPANAIAASSGRFSPDGRLLAFSRGPTGGTEVYIQKVGGTDMPVRVSINGGINSQWTRGGHELMYRSGGQLLAVDVSEDTKGQIRVSPPRVILARAFEDPSFQSFAVTRDGNRIVLLRPPPRRQPALDVLVDWKADIEARLKAAK